MSCNLYIRIRSKDKKHETPFASRYTETGTYLAVTKGVCVKVVEPALQLFC